MKYQFYFVILAFIIAACGQQNTKEQKENNNQQTSDIAHTENKEQTSNGSAGTIAESKENNNESNGFWEKLEMKAITDVNGTVQCVMPMPASWKFSPGNGSEGRTITGPNGIKVVDYPGKNFMYNYDARLQQSYAAAGQQMRAFPGVEQWIQQDFVPWGDNNGLQFVKYYEIPDISRIDRWYSDQLFKAVPAKYDIAAIGIEWKSNAGKPYFLIVHLNVSTNQQMQLWYYTASGFEADEAYFEAAKKQFIFSMSNTRYNLEPIAAYNQKEAQRCGQSWAAFNQRMAQNQANFEASQRAHINRSNAVNDAIMSGWRERNASSDRQQAQNIDGIYERTNVQDPTTGQTYKVAAGSNQYWMNSNGEYISTQLNDYNPNLDDNMNQQKWQQLREVKN